MHFFQGKLKLLLSKMIIALKVIIDFSNHFRLAALVLIAKLI